MFSRHAALAVLVAAVGSAPAQAAVVISSAATQNMNCSGGTCVPTATSAVLNADDLENDLAQFGNVRVMTTGTGVEANNIVVKAPFATPDSTSLTLDAHRTITVNAAVSIGASTAELELQSNKGGGLGTLSFGPKGHIIFGSLSDIFGINGGIFTLVGSVQELASAVAANPSGAFALGNDYDASGDGTYASAPIRTTFTGTFEGLGNTISNLAINDPADKHFVGLFAQTDAAGTLRDIGLSHANVAGGKGTKRHVTEAIGVLVGVNGGTVLGAWVKGKTSGQNSSYIGGLVGANNGLIETSSADVTMAGGALTVVGGLVGQNAGGISGSRASGKVEGLRKVSRLFDGGGLVGLNLGGTITLSYASGTVEAYFAGGLVGENGAYQTNGITYCFATGAVTWTRGTGDVGGLVGGNYGPIANSYSTGAVTGGKLANLGGLVGVNEGTPTIVSSYSTGMVIDGNDPQYIGGFIGYDENPGYLSDTYWDTDKSGITNLSQGAGNVANDPGITGLTTAQFQSGLPTGFDPKVWAENPNINGGLPYLIDNPPPK